MDDYVLLENPARKRRKKTRSRRADGRFKKTSSRRKTKRRRRNPATTKRRSATTVAKRRPARRRRNMSASPARRNPSRRRRRSSGRGGKVLSVNRVMNIVKDGAGFAAAEFVGDIVARAVYFKVPGAPEMFRRLGIDGNAGITWMQLALGIFGGPMLRKFKFVPRAVVKHWELANTASALVQLTYGWREQAYSTLQLEGYGGSGGVADWVTAPRAAPSTAPAIAPNAGLSDWANVGMSAGYTGDPFSS